MIEWPRNVDNMRIRWLHFLLSPCKSMIPSCETQQHYNKETLLNEKHSTCNISPGPQQTRLSTTAFIVVLHCRCNCMLKITMLIQNGKNISMHFLRGLRIKGIKLAAIWLESHNEEYQLHVNIQLCILTCGLLIKTNYTAWNLI